MLTDSQTIPRDLCHPQAPLKCLFFPVLRSQKRQNEQSCHKRYNVVIVGIKTGRSHHCTWVFTPSAPLDEADYEEDEHDESHGTHDPDEPALSGDVHLVLSVDCTWKKDIIQVNIHSAL